MKMKDQKTYLIKIYRKKKIKPIVFETTNKEQFNNLFDALVHSDWIIISDLILRSDSIKYVIKEEV